VGVLTWSVLSLAQLMLLVESGMQAFRAVYVRGYAFVSIIGDISLMRAEVILYRLF
jgi:hypothetical protein